jgi:hypothetical protein|tara:strand:- start:196 stop:480 length:285 start_codon:yes stop_codon:yes gene_type:complete
MKTKQIEEKDLKELKELNTEKNTLTINFGRLKTDMILLDAKMKELAKMEEDMVAKFKGNETKGKKAMERMNKKYGSGTINIDNGTFTPEENGKS